ncbi:MAG: 50S ribosomal protein L13 [Candidatus Shikimatogenerans bostrichidophilus]|nr:MAG: 50S ribosomal protein L13 [Candidatus Shikimatogenerans bostrichidophilus]
MKYLNLKTKFYFKKKTYNYLINAKNKILGRLSSIVIKLLIGKNLINYTPNFNFINKVIIINSKKIKLNKNKIKKKIYYKYTGYVGNKKKYTMKYLFNKNSNLIIKKSIFRMLPKNLLGKYAKKNLYIFENKKHNLNLKLINYNF